MAGKKKRKEGWLTLLDLVTALQTLCVSRPESRRERTGDCSQTRLQDRSGLSFIKRSGVKPLELFIIMLGGSFWTDEILRNTKNFSS